MPNKDHRTTVIQTAQVVSAYLRCNKMPLADVPKLIRSTFDALARSEGNTPSASAPLVPAVDIHSSVKPDSVTCLECGREMKMLRRHLRIEHGISVEGYIERWGLAENYPVIALDYAKTRSDIAKAARFRRRAEQERNR